MISSQVAVVSTQVMTCHQSTLPDQQDSFEAFEIIEVEEGKRMENNFRSMTLSRVTGTLKSRKGTSVSSSVDSGLENEYTQIPNGLAGVYPSMWVKIKYPIAVDDASPNGMLSPSDLDAVLQGIQQDFNTWQVFLETKRTTNYCKHALPRNISSDPPKQRIVVKVKFSAWVTRIDPKMIESAVNEVMNKSGEFFVEVQTEKIKK